MVRILFKGVCNYSYMVNRMPVVFIGHGSPENALVNNEFNANWKLFGKQIPKPKAILCISAHWETFNTKVNSKLKPELIYDFYGFQKELYQLKYPCNGSLELANEIKNLFKNKTINLDLHRGLDHGCWAVLIKMFPKGDIPILQLSLDTNISFKNHFEIGKQLTKLRDAGILIIGSGNIVHNLSLFNPDKSYKWAIDFDKYLKENLMKLNFENLINIERNINFNLAHPSNEHYLPLLYIIGASNNETPQFFNEKVISSLSMTCIIFSNTKLKFN